jgi:argininosuccinate lyase
MTENDQFPAPSYKETVLAPLFDIVKRHHFRPLLAIDRAHAVMLHECGWLTRDEVRAILAALADIEANVDPMALTYTGQFEDLFFVIQEAVMARAGADVGGKLHTGRSRNDIDHTLFRLALKHLLADYRTALLELIATLLDTAERHAAIIVVAYTHGQPAQPSTFGHYLAAFAEVLQRDAARLAAASATVDRCSLGAAAITTSGFKLDRARVAALLGFAAPVENAYGAIAACDYITEPYAALRVHAINLGRFVQDLNQWTGFETGHLHVPDGFVQISSIMPQKRNPVPIEHMRLLASLAAGHAETVIATMHNTPFTDMNDAEAEVQAAGHAAFESGQRVLRLLGPFTASLTVNAEQAQPHRR